MKRKVPDPLPSDNTFEFFDLDGTDKLIGSPLAIARLKRFAGKNPEFFALPETMPTLRDQFAMAALTGIFANPSYTDFVEMDCLIDSEVAYQYADAMLEARKK